MASVVKEALKAVAIALATFVVDALTKRPKKP